MSPSSRTGSSDDSSRAEAVRFGARLQRLIDVGYPEGDRRYTDAEIATSVGVSAQYIANLRHAKSLPRLEKAVKLAAFFGLDSWDYFVKPDDDPAVLAVDRRARTLDAQRRGQHVPASDDAGHETPDIAELWTHLKNNRDVQRIASRATQLSPEGLAAVLGVVDQILGATPPPTTPSDES
ncbi:helix-turn-helix domain-containing protein [Streptomyces sp. NPDC059009]|uniref:helix-turn-helix domain-containing protein n=1 Tax=Streptomyces sp. NPDC059009 TaxID=3346694 RepID=UPI0036A2F119